MMFTRSCIIATLAASLLAVPLLGLAPDAPFGSSYNDPLARSSHTNSHAQSRPLVAWPGPSSSAETSSVQVNDPQSNSWTPGQDAHTNDGAGDISPVKRNANFGVNNNVQTNVPYLWQNEKYPQAPSPGDISAYSNPSQSVAQAPQHFTSSPNAVSYSTQSVPQAPHSTSSSSSPAAGETSAFSYSTQSAAQAPHSTSLSSSHTSGGTSAFSYPSQPVSLAPDSTSSSLSPAPNNFSAFSYAPQPVVQAPQSASSKNYFASQSYNALPGLRQNSMAFMVTQKMKRVLIEDLRYSRQEVNGMGADQARSIINSRLSNPGHVDNQLNTPGQLKP